MKFLLTLLLSALVVVGLSYILPGVAVEGYLPALLAALVLAVLNAFLRPLLVFLTIPLTILTFGLFLFVINAALILLTAYLVQGFHVDGFWWALLFSVLLSLAVALLEATTGKKLR